MTLDEAINYEKRMEDYYFARANVLRMSGKKYRATACMVQECAYKHNNMRLWLTELKHRRENDKR